MALYDKTIYELRELLDKKEVSASEVLDSYIDRIEAVDTKLDAFLTKTFDLAKKNAKESEERILKGETLSVLDGIPYALKDNMCTKDIRTTCSSKLLDNFIPPYSATVYKKLQKSGAVLLGKVDMDEFAMGSSNENSAYHIVKNPWDTSRVPGGSSGASAVSVSAGEAAFSLGSDTGGSIRTPAAFCGVTGLKPTYGRVSRYGLVAFASSLDQIGPFGKDIKDVASVLNVIAGHDENDSTSMKVDVPDYTSFLSEDIKGMKVGVDYALLDENKIDKDVVYNIRKAIDKFKEMGAEIVDISFDCFDYAIPVYYLISSSEASSNLSRFDGIRYGVREEGETLEDIIINSRTKGFGEEVKRRILLGTYALSAGYYDMYYNKALKVRKLIKDLYNDIFKKCDIVLTPTTPGEAFKIGEKTTDQTQMYLADIFTVTANLVGIPAASIPCGMSENSMPIGLQISANVFDEGKIIKAAYNYQNVTNHHKQKPNL
ncbi:Asp-tRNA(Asn)/Glu-tRNA(Gln) amidotransferase subunit GatA [Anaerofustis stercorihominis]|uniref:Glutamyl-tRNA(Gln) amidotransferase subunit A n=1 Tax=Anaerofustis stercorihominis TaxID=214853 RepID=A0A3E3DWS5_9FIRM|nr:Asp-tRNA(Asn)/Glu-tRNA(Gln) amidotransferase subunit GatA [Anaerofustis stercorihominis]RGD73737.1 Asp-tRNA(Asn)/Glu-tRNA(Gln) amidotransferase subunit GatA [Anaerofustis stercorihominis]